MKWETGPKIHESFNFILQDPGDIDYWDGLIELEVPGEEGDPDLRTIKNFYEHLRKFIECKFDDDVKV